MKKIFALAIFSLMTASLNGQSVSSALRAVLQNNLGRGGFPNDIAMTGDLTQAGGQAQPIQILIKGKDRMRFEIGSGRDMQVTIFSRESASRTSSNAVDRMGPQTGLRRPTIIPALDLLSEMDNPRIEIQSGGSVALGGIAAYQYRLRLLDSWGSRRPFRRPLDEEVDVFVDAASGLILRTDRLRTAENDLDLKVPSVLQFSDYRRVGALAIPFRIVNTIGSGASARTTFLTIRTAQINSGASDAAFVHPEVRP